MEIVQSLACGSDLRCCTKKAKNDGREGGGVVWTVGIGRVSVSV